MANASVSICRTSKGFVFVVVVVVRGFHILIAFNHNEIREF